MPDHHGTPEPMVGIDAISAGLAEQHEEDRQAIAAVIYEAWTLREWGEPRVHPALDAAAAVMAWIQDRYE